LYENIISGEVKNYYVDDTLKLLEDELVKSKDDLFEQMEFQDKLILGIFMAIFLLFYTTIWVRILKNLYLDIMITISLLNILPTCHLARNPHFMKKLSKSSIFK
jgi:hypothetical protein